MLGKTEVGVFAEVCICVCCQWVVFECASVCVCIVLSMYAKQEISLSPEVCSKKNQ